ncbi:MAG: SoxR reducing system RseC family protein [Thermodesulfovibrionia bacterium]|nr:SoxR reducing system RseC family protein [Thermodesulfovibrionia bacterium]
MIEETGVVIRTEGITATVLVQKRGSCEGCTATGTCATTQEGMEIEALNPVQAEAGQTVKVSIQSMTYLKGTMLVYGFPMIALIAGAVIGKNIGEKFFSSFDSDLCAAIFGFSAFLLAFLFAKVYSRKAETKTEYKPVISEIVS